jgi:Bacteriocin-protection, YdeI or OmpD-Associated/Domain of unknown function (DUF1905)
MKRTFVVALDAERNFEVPFDVRAVYGEARPAVKMTLLGKTFRTRVSVYGGKYFLGLWKAVREEHALEPGQELEVTLEPDHEPREIAAPKELAAAMKKNAAARAGWDAMSFTHKREWATAIADAKKPETRERRVAQAIAALVAKASAKSKPKLKRKPKPKLKRKPKPKRKA